MAIGITSPPPRINAAQRRANNQISQQPHRVNAAERRLINQGQMPAQSNYQGNPQQPRPQAPTSGPQTGGGAQMAPQQGFNQMGMQPMQRPTFQNPKQFAPGQFPQWYNQMPQGFPQQFNPQFGGGYGGGQRFDPQFQYSGNMQPQSQFPTDGSAFGGQGLPQSYGTPTGINGQWFGGKRI
jgi:hypothetical protein